MTTRALPIQKYVAELLGAFALSFAIGLSLVQDISMPTIAIAAVVLGTFVYLFAPLSGAHLNPAITVALFSAKRMPFRDALYYVVMQLLGGWVALMLLSLLDLGRPDVVVEDTLGVAWGEIIGTCMLALGVSAVHFNKVPEAATGLVVGSSLFIGIVLASGTSLGVLNPAVALGINAVSFMYVLAPVAGAIIGVWLFMWMQGLKMKMKK